LLDDRVLETWISVLHEALGDTASCFGPVFDYIGRSRINLDKPLFATIRKKTFDTHLEEAIAAVQTQATEEAQEKQTTAPLLPASVIDAIEFLAPKHMFATSEHLRRNRVTV